MARLLKLREHAIIDDLDKLTYEQIAQKHNCCVKTVYNIKKRDDARKLQTDISSTDNSVKSVSSTSNTSNVSNSTSISHNNKYAKSNISTMPVKLTKNEETMNKYVDDLLKKREHEYPNYNQNVEYDYKILNSKNNQEKYQNASNKKNNASSTNNINTDYELKSFKRQKIDELRKIIMDN